MNTQQVSQTNLFTPTESTRKLSSSSLSKYDSALKHLRMILSGGKSEQLFSTEFGKQFGISSSFLSALHQLGALDRQKAGNGGFRYSAKQMLSIIGPELVLKHIRVEAERTAEETRKKTEAKNVVAPNEITEGEPGIVSYSMRTPEGEWNEIVGNVVSFGPGSVISVPNTESRGINGIQLFGIVNEVMAERHKQFTKWGYQDCAPLEWFAILSEEIGEVAKEVVDFHMAGMNITPEGSKDYRTELIQVAAVAIQAIQVLDDQVKQSGH